MSKEAFDYLSYSNDNQNGPAGLEIILERVNRESVILDANCGIGSYLCGLAPHVKQIIGLEQDRSMLDQVVRKVAELDLIPKVDLFQGSLLEKLPFDDNFFDGVIINQFPFQNEKSESDFSNLKQLLKEFERVLKPGGFLSVNLTTQEQANSSFWWKYLMPPDKTVHHLHIPNDLLINYLTEVGLQFEQMVECKEPLQGNDYFNPAGPLDENWRKTDNSWLTLTEEEIEGIKELVQTMLDQGIAGHYMDKYDDIRRQIGQSTFVISQKPF